MATITITSNNTLTPIRRISWKGGDFRKVMAMNEEYNEKDILGYPTSETTAHDVQTASPSALDTPTRLSSSTLCNDNEDIEGQHDPGFHVRSNSWRNKLVEYTMVFMIFLVWMLLIMGVLILTDTLFPTALRSYYKFKELSAELSNTNFELDALKTQMSTLYQSIGRIGTMTIQKFRK
ncbi:hypothetical protein T440DRAFT_548883 [Plenodomus tracheiphilus IPT5]|uniref:Uncharacterized protein n=1 Tax=Plenodomus tracheiphilus IPT5 TaxID=1408161 RepID=A0A6A7BCE6_9PLEO|nr:hypothetical protein T440DRAFT_548883 [Plenodomus tracheiphilus IPT5]